MPRIHRVALPVPLRRLFDYLPPSGAPAGALSAGMRVRVPFGRQNLIGLIVSDAAESQVPDDRLRPIEAVLDAVPVLTPELMELLRWAWDYYHHPPGEVLTTALPVLLRRGVAARRQKRRGWVLTPAGVSADPHDLARAPRQRALTQLLGTQTRPLASAELDGLFPAWRNAMAGLKRRGWVEQRTMEPAEAEASAVPAPDLNPDQRQAADALHDAHGAFGAFLLQGVTGSGKTEVYMEAIARCIGGNKQALVVVPEIGLTPQLCARFQARFPGKTGVLHSALTDRERLDTWCAARDGEVAVIIGTRSAVFTPLKNPGLIVVDEEHDLSLKQQEGFRYSARDLAVMRARLCDVPAMLGSATPSLESLHNAERSRYRRLLLPHRATGHAPPEPRILDVRSRPMSEGLADQLITRVRQHLTRGGQVLLFLNRRGFAPVLMCHDCGWTGDCPRCDAHMTLHAASARLRCHHCGTERPAPATCPSCDSGSFAPVGHGTERLERFLSKVFKTVPVLRIDRDTTRRKGQLEKLLDAVRAGEPAILVGTQMLAKGHDFPNITLAGIVDVDQGLFSTDFRGPERVAQLIVQVAGRAGRGQQPGDVVLQTHHPDHPVLVSLLARGYEGFAGAALEERQAAGLPPAGFLALLRAEAPGRDTVERFMEKAARLGRPESPVQMLGPVPAPMERRSGRFRFQLLIQSPARDALHGFLDGWVERIEDLDSARRVRWSLDVDPVDMY